MTELDAALQICKMVFVVMKAKSGYGSCWGRRRRVDRRKMAEEFGNDVAAPLWTLESVLEVTRARVRGYGGPRG